MVVVVVVVVRRGRGGEAHPGVDQVGEEMERKEWKRRRKESKEEETKAHHGVDQVRGRGQHCARRAPVVVDAQPAADVEELLAV